MAFATGVFGHLPGWQEKEKEERAKLLDIEERSVLASNAVKAGMSYPEANAKYGTSIYPTPKGGVVKVLVGAAGGFLAGGPVGAAIGAISAFAGTEAQEAQISKAAHSDAAAYKVEAAAQIEAQKQSLLSSSAESSYGSFLDKQAYAIMAIGVGVWWVFFRKKRKGGRRG